MISQRSNQNWFEKLLLRTTQFLGLYAAFVNAAPMQATMGQQNALFTLDQGLLDLVTPPHFFNNTFFQIANQYTVDDSDINLALIHDDPAYLESFLQKKPTEIEKIRQLWIVAAEANKINLFKSLLQIKGLLNFIRNKGFILLAVDGNIAALEFLKNQGIKPALAAGFNLLSKWDKAIKTNAKVQFLYRDAFDLLLKQNFPINNFYKRNSLMTFAIRNKMTLAAEILLNNNFSIYNYNNVARSYDPYIAFVDNNFPIFKLFLEKGLSLKEAGQRKIPVEWFMLELNTKLNQIHLPQNRAFITAIHQSNVADLFYDNLKIYSVGKKVRPFVEDLPYILREKGLYAKGTLLGKIEEAVRPHTLLLALFTFSMTGYQVFRLIVHNSKKPKKIKRETGDIVREKIGLEPQSQTRKLIKATLSLRTTLKNLVKYLKKQPQAEIIPEEIITATIHRGKKGRRASCDFTVTLDKNTRFNIGKQSFTKVNSIEAAVRDDEMPYESKEPRNENNESFERDLDAAILLSTKLVNQEVTKTSSKKLELKVDVDEEVQGPLTPGAPKQNKIESIISQPTLVYPKPQNLKRYFLPISALPKAAYDFYKTLETLTTNENEIFIVGGTLTVALKNHLLNQAIPHPATADIDLITKIAPDKITQKFPNSIRINEGKLIQTRINNIPFDICQSDPLKEIPDIDSAIYCEATRRDFTVTSLLARLVKDNFIDESGNSIQNEKWEIIDATGLATPDIKNNLLRTLRTADVALKEDPSLIFRALYNKFEKNYLLEESLSAAINSQKANLKNLPDYRLSLVTKLLRTKNRTAIWDELNRRGLVTYFKYRLNPITLSLISAIEKDKLYQQALVIEQNRIAASQKVIAEQLAGLMTQPEHYLNYLREVAAQQAIYWRATLFTNQNHAQQSQQIPQNSNNSLRPY